MAFYAKLMAGAVNETTQPGGIDVVPVPTGYKCLKVHEARTADGKRGIRITGVGDTYTGEPPASLVERPDVSIRTPENLPWPGSAEDRFCQYPEREQRPRRDGRPHRGPMAMAHAAQRGEWPNETTKQWNRYLEAKLANPKKAAKALLSRQGVQGRELERRATVYAERVAPGGPPDLDQMISDFDATEAEEEAARVPRVPNQGGRSTKTPTKPGEDAAAG